MEGVGFRVGRSDDEDHDKRRTLALCPRFVNKLDTQIGHSGYPLG